MTDKTFPTPSEVYSDNFKALVTETPINRHYSLQNELKDLFSAYTALHEAYEALRTKKTIYICGYCGSSYESKKELGRCGLHASDVEELQQQLEAKDKELKASYKVRDDLIQTAGKRIAELEAENKELWESIKI